MELLATALLLLLSVIGVLGDLPAGSSEYDEFSNEDYDNSLRAVTIQELAVKHAPFLKFHKTEGDEGFCFPHNASDYYNLRSAEDWSRQCNEDYSSIHAGRVPTYWHAMECGRHLHIAYWNFYGYNHACDCCSGERDAWWEFIVVKVREWATNPHMHEVMFGQKHGWYTRFPGNYGTLNATHPMAYVGRASHGFYHDDGGSNTCCYWEDTRNPGDPDQYMMTWHNLVELRNDGDGEAWMVDPGTHPWSGLQVPTYRDDWDLCGLRGCEGSFMLICGTSGCAKSDIGDDPF